jgi:Fe-S cluster assembly iron-binding protein IscA
MITVTPLAQERLSQFLTENKTIRHVRVFLPSAGCGGQGQLSLTVDDPQDSDYTATVGDIIYSINKNLQEQTGKVVIDFKVDGQDSGFIVDPEKILPALDSDCGGCGCCG